MVRIIWNYLRAHAGGASSGSGSDPDPTSDRHTPLVGACAKVLRAVRTSRKLQLAQSWKAQESIISEG